MGDPAPHEDREDEEVPEREVSSDEIHQFMHQEEYRLLGEYEREGEDRRT